MNLGQKIFVKDAKKPGESGILAGGCTLLQERGVHHFAASMKLAIRNADQPTKATSFCIHNYFGKRQNSENFVVWL